MLLKFTVTRLLYIIKEYIELSTKMRIEAKTEAGKNI